MGVKYEEMGVLSSSFSLLTPFLQQLRIDVEETGFLLCFGSGLQCICTGGPDRKSEMEAGWNNFFNMILMILNRIKRE